MSTRCAGLGLRDDKAYFRDLFRRAEAARVPLAGSLELTRRCNLRCPHCYLGPQEKVRAGGNREISTAQAIGILSQLVDAGCLSLVITGGDPLLRPDFAEIYRRAKRSGMSVTIFTNGTPITDRIVTLFQDLPPRAVEITLYGASASTYEKVTGVPGSHRRCLDGIQRLRSAGIRFSLKTMLMTANSHELEAMEEMARDYGAEFRFDPVLNARLDGGREPLALRVDVREAVRLEFADPKRRRGWAQFHARSPEAPASDRLVQCGAGETQFHVDAFGNLQPCLMLPGVSHSLLAGTFAEGWGRIGAWRNTAAASRNGCASCPRRPYCDYCPGLLALESGDPETPSAYLCALGGERLRAISLLSQEEQ